MKGHECQVKRTWKENERNMQEKHQNERNMKGNEHKMKAKWKEHRSKMKGIWKEPFWEGSWQKILRHRGCRAQMGAGRKETWNQCWCISPAIAIWKTNCLLWHFLPSHSRLPRHRLNPSSCHPVYFLPGSGTGVAGWGLYKSNIQVSEFWHLKTFNYLNPILNRRFEEWRDSKSCAHRNIGR